MGSSNTRLGRRKRHRCITNSMAHCATYEPMPNRDEYFGQCNAQKFKRHGFFSVMSYFVNKKFVKSQSTKNKLALNSGMNGSLLLGQQPCNNDDGLFSNNLMSLSHIAQSFAEW